MKFFEENCEIALFIGKKIRFLRLLSSKTQGELAKELNVTRSCISNYESGTRLPDKEMLLSIARLFNIDVNFFFTPSCGVSSESKLYKSSARCSDGSSASESGSFVSSNQKMLNLYEYSLHFNSRFGKGGK